MKSSTVIPIAATIGALLLLATDNALLIFWVSLIALIGFSARAGYQKSSRESVIVMVLSFFVAAIAGALLTYN